MAGKKGINLGKKNNMWKGDSVGRVAIHTWLKRHYGQPDKCELCGKIDKPEKIEWAKLTGKNYERKRENFWRLCRKCHVHYDKLIGKRFEKGHVPWAKGKHWKIQDTSKMKGRSAWNKGLLGFRKGHPATNTKPNSGSFKKGQHYSIKTEFKKGYHYHPSTEFKKGIIPKNKGKKFVNGHYI